MKIAIPGAAIVVLLASISWAQEALVTYKTLAPDVALELARASLEACRARGYQVAVAVVDRFGQPQVMLRDRFATLGLPSLAIDRIALFRQDDANSRFRIVQQYEIAPA